MKVKVASTEGKQFVEELVGQLISNGFEVDVYENAGSAHRR